MENVPQGPGNVAKVWSKSRRAYGGLGYSFSPKVKLGNISAKKLETVSFQKVLLCHFHFEPRPSGVSLETPTGVENIPQIPGNLA